MDLWPLDDPYSYDRPVSPSETENLPRLEQWVLSAVMKRDLVLLRDLVELKGVNIDFVCAFGTPLITSIKMRYEDVFTFLLEAGVNIDMQDFRGWTALHWAASMGNVDAVDTLLHLGANSGIESNSGKSAVDLAVLRGHTLCANRIDPKWSEPPPPAPATSLPPPSATAPAPAPASPPPTEPTPAPVSVKGKASSKVPSTPAVGAKSDDDMSTLAEVKAEDVKSKEAVKPAKKENVKKEKKEKGEGGDRKEGGDAGKEGEAKKEEGQGGEGGDMVNRVCEDCGTSDTPQWRRGPTGDVTLCNACGLKFCHQQNRETKNARRRELYLLQKRTKEAQRQEQRMFAIYDHHM